MLGRKLFKKVLLFGVLLTVLFSCIHAIIDYRRHFGLVEESLEQLRKVHQKGIAEALWNYDRKVLAAQIDGMMNQPYVEFVVIEDSQGVVVSEGLRLEDAPTYTYSLLYEYLDKIVELGKIQIQVNNKKVLEETFQSVWRIILVQLVTITLALTLAFWLLNRNVTRYLVKIAAYFNSREDKPLVLGKKDEHDEIDILVKAINTMRVQLKNAHDELKKSRDQYFHLYNETPVLLHSIDVNGKLIEVNNFWLNTMGYEREEVIGKVVTDVYTENSRKFAHEIIWPEFFTTGLVREVPFQWVKKNGEIIDVLLSAIGERDLDGKVSRSLAVIENVTERKKSQSALEEALRQKDVLIQEVHHRVKNNLNVISGILFLQAQSVKDELFKNILLQNQARVRSLALVHEQLHSSSNVEVVDLSDFVKLLVQNLAGVLKDSKIQLQTEVEKIYLPINQAVPCGLIINELIYNSIKHAFPEKANGYLSINIKRVVEQSEQVLLTIRDDGIGLPENFDLNKTKSTGMKIVDAFSMQLRGKYTFSNQQGQKGTVFEMLFPYVGTERV